MTTLKAGFLAALAFLGLLCIPQGASAQNERGCAWPLLMSPEGTANLQLLDNAARYWVMPFDTTQYKSMTIQGTYPNVRYFSFAAYATTDDGFITPTKTLYDAQIAPDPGSTNPFVWPGRGGGTYTVVVSSSGTSSGNTIVASSTSVVWIVLRMYVSDADPTLNGRNLMGGVPLPAITLTDNSGVPQGPKPCSPVNKWADLSTFAQILFPPGRVLPVDEGTPLTDRLWFAPPHSPPSFLWPNPDGKYMMMLPGKDYQSGRIIVIHGKAPGFPDTFNGAPIWVPARGFRHVDVRYWAACFADFVPPFSIVDCATDLTTPLDQGYYTIVISDDRQRPDWLRPDVKWLPWGDEQYPKVVAFRNMLPAADFSYSVQEAWENCAFDLPVDRPLTRNLVDEKGPCSEREMREYYPVAVWCDKSKFVRGGWDACVRSGPY